MQEAKNYILRRVLCIQDVVLNGDGEVAENNYASKGGGGVFIKKKLIGSMAKEYIFL